MSVPTCSVQAVLFDAGNTLIFPDYAFVRELLAGYGLKITEGRLKELDFAAKARAQTAAAKRPWNHYFTLWFTSAGLPEENVPEALSKLWQRHRRRSLWSEVEETAVETLQALRERGLKRGVVSNSDGHLEPLLAQVGLRQYFDVIVDSERVGVRKPDERIFRLALQALQVAPEAALFVGDSYELDYEAARKVGMQALLYDPLRQYKNCDTIGQLRELLDRLR